MKNLSRPDDKPMLRQASLPGISQSRADIILSSTALNILALALPIMILQVYDRIVPNNATDTLLLLVVGVGIALILESFFRLGRSYVTTYAGAKFEHIAGCRALAKTMGTDIVGFEKEAAGVYLHRFNAIDSLRDFMSGNNLLVFIDLPFAIIFIGMVAYIGGILVLAPLGLFVFFSLMTLLVGRGLKKTLQERAIWDNRRFNFLIEVLTGIHTVKGLALEAQMVRRYERLQETTAGVIKTLAFQNNVAQSLGSIFSQLTLISVAGFGSILVIEETLTIGGLAACTLLSGRALQPLLRAMGVWTHYQNVELSKERVNSLLNLPQENESLAYQAQSGNKASINLSELNSNAGISFENISFRYSVDDETLLENVNCHFPAGSVTAITGGNGSGKSTILWLLKGMMPPTNGRVLVNGENISSISRDVLHKDIAYLPQNGVIFHGTIMENLTLFRKGEWIDKAIVQAKILGLDEAIKTMPLGYDTVVGDGATDSLPGGIRQRIAIARALVSDPEIVLFDEANTSLDAASDDILKEALLKLKGKCTIILVSHRPSLVKIADYGYKISGRKMIDTPVDQLIPYGRPAPKMPPSKVVS